MARKVVLPARNQVKSPRNQVKSPFQECFDSLGEVHNEDAYGAIERLVQAGEEIGFTVKDLIRMLHAGMSLGSLLDVIEVRMRGSCMHTESSTA
jgi:hypothetical protein